MPSATAFVHGPHMQAYNPSADEERPVRRALGLDLLGAYGLLDHPDVTRVDPRIATDEEIATVHAPAYVRAVRRYSATPVLAGEPEAAQWGFAMGDTIARAGMHEAAAAACGAALVGAQMVWEGDVLQAFCPAPAGLHHALANRASGMCIYNDAGVAIRWLLDNGAERVAYVDVDAHHGDGVQWMFYEDPRVLTCSVHESGRYLFPGTGGLGERGVGAAVGTSVNIPLPPYAGDGPYLRALREVIAPAVRRFRPDVIITHNGVDPHHTDPMSHLQVTQDGFTHLFHELRDLAFDACGGRWVVLTGGGYNIDLLARLWARLFASMIDAPLADEVPAGWLAAARDLTGRDFTASLMEETPFAIGAAEREAGDAEGHRVVDQAALLLSA